MFTLLGLFLAVTDRLALVPGSTLLILSSAFDGVAVAASLSVESVKGLCMKNTDVTVFTPSKSFQGTSGR